MAHFAAHGRKVDGCDHDPAEMSQRFYANPDLFSAETELEVVCGLVIECL